MKDKTLKYLKKVYPKNKVVKTEEGYAVLFNDKELEALEMDIPFPRLNTQKEYKLSEYDIESVEKDNNIPPDKEN